MVPNNNSITNGYLYRPGPKLIFACSGASDVGEIADQVARRLNKEGMGRIFCLAGIGGWINWIITSTNKAKKILVIDGCPQECAKKTLENSGFEEFEHICLADLGLEKGKSPVTKEIIEAVSCKIRGLTNYLWNIKDLNSLRSTSLNENFQ